MRILYPNNPLRPKQPDEQFVPETEAVRAAGMEVSLFSLEEFQAGTFHMFPATPKNTSTLYRGWMLSAPEYEDLVTAMTKAEANPVINSKEYTANHYLPNWYPLIADLTSETQIFPLDCDLESELRKLGWNGFFIKDYVKSLKTSVGSRISKPEEISEVVAAMRKYRGSIEGGFCVRRIEDFKRDTERRYFVVNGVPRAPESEIPPIVHECAKRLSSRFYSVDAAERTDGQLRIVEVGDGQVSDLVGWLPIQFADILKTFAV